jgi:hypothetical protein
MKIKPFSVLAFWQKEMGRKAALKKLLKLTRGIMILQNQNVKRLSLVSRATDV